MPREYGSSGGDFSNEIRNARELTAQTGVVNEKLAEYRAETEAISGTEAGSAKVRSGLADTTEGLSAALRANVGSLTAETAALRTNTALLERQLELREALRTSAGGSGGGGLWLPPTAVGGTGPEEDPNVLRQRLAQREQQIANLTARGSLASAPLVVGGGTASERAGSVAPSLEDAAAKKEAQTYFDNVAKNEEAIKGMGAAQASANTEFQAAAASYASSSNALSRHGALTTEFIQALARGQVTMREFGSQMVSTIGKFGGWIAAGAAVYGVVKLFGDLTKGATETQTAVEQMGRFIPGLGGPAGGGSGQIAPFEGQLRGISTQFNVPISEVSDSMMVMARTFHNVTDAANATRAALAVQILDQVPQAQSEQYLLGIANSMGFGGRHGGGQQTIDVVNQLNALQSQGYGRVSQVLPGVARAAPAALASGTSLNQLEALVGLGVRGGLTGNQVGTALLRSMTGFAFRPGSEATYGRFGVTAIPGEYGNLIGQIMNTISERAQSGHPLGRSALADLASALGGPQLGGRSILPLLVQQSQHPNENLYQNVLDATRHPRPYQEDLNQVLDTVGQRFKAIGIALQNFGSQLAESGALQPLITMLGVFKDLATAVTNTLSPMSRLLGFFNVFPGWMQQLAGALAVFGAARWAATSTRFGGAATAAISRLPGLGGLYGDSRAEVEGAVGRYQTYVEPVQQSELDAARVARLRAASRAEQAQNLFNSYAVSSAPARAGELGGQAQIEADTRLTTYRQAQEQAARTLTEATDKEATAEVALAQTQADIAILKNKQLSWADRATYLEQRGAIASEELVSVKQRLIDQGLAQLRTGEAGTAAVTGLAATGAAAARAGGLSGDAALIGATVLAGGAAVVGGVTATQRAEADAQQVARGQMAMWDASVGRDAGPAQQGLFPLPSPVGGASALTEEEQTAVQASLRSRIAARFGALASGPALPLAGALVSGSIPGYAGQSLQSGFSDMLLASFIPGAGAAAKVAAFALGAGTTPRTNVGLPQHLLQTGELAAAGGFGARALSPLINRGLAAGTSLLSKLPFLSEGTSAALDVAAPEVGIPLTIGATLLSGALGWITGSSTPPPPPQPSGIAANQDAQAALHAVIYGGAKGRAAFGSNVSSMLASAYLDTGATAQRNGQTAQAIVGSLTAQLGLFGTGTPEGQAAQSGIAQFMQAAAPYARENPVFTQQLMSTFTQSSNAEIQRRFQFQLTQGGPSANSAAQAAIARTRATTVAPLQQAMANQQTTLAAQVDALNGLEDRYGSAAGGQKNQLARQINSQRQAVARSQANIQTLSQMLNLGRQNAALQEQQYAQQQLQAQQTSDQAQLQLQVAKAGGDTVKAAEATYLNSLKVLGQVSSSHLTGRARTDALAQARAGVIASHAQQGQAGLTDIEASNAIAEASAPVGNAAADAQAKAQSAYNVWEYMKNNSFAFGPAQIKQAWANVLQARKDALQAAADQATQLNDIHTQIAQAQASGDVVAQAGYGIAGAQHDVATATTPVGKAQAQLQLASAYNAAHQAAQQRIQEQGQLAIALNQGDSLAAAGASVTLAQRMLASAHGVDEQLQAQAQLASANYAYAQAVEQRIQLQGAVAEAQAQGNPVEVARIAIATAQKELANAAGVDQQLQAQKDLADAQFAYAAALMNQDTELAALKASTTTDPLQQLRDQIAGAVKALADAKGPEQHRTAQTNLNNLRNQYETTLIDTKNSTIDFNLQMQNITTQQAISQLQALIHMKGITQAQRQHILEEIKQLEQGGGFDIAPGNIKMPTPYDVAHAMLHGHDRTDEPHGGGRGDGGGQHHHRPPVQHHHVHTDASRPQTTNNIRTEATVNVYVGSDADIHKVADAIDRSTGSHLRARMRSAGLRGG